METTAYETLFARATEALRPGSAAESLALWDELLAGHPAAISARYNRGLALEMLNRSADAAAAFADYLERAPDDVDGLVKYGRHARTAGQRTPARLSLDRALELAPGRADAHAQRALVFLDLGDNAAAARDCDAAIQNGLDAPWVRYNRALGRKRTGDRAGAVADLDHAIRAEPLDADFWAMRGTLRLELGDAGGAGDTREAARLDPSRAAASPSTGDGSGGETSPGREMLVSLGGFLGMLALLGGDILLLIHVLGPLANTLPWLGWPLVILAGVSFFPIAIAAMSFKIRFAVALIPWLFESLLGMRHGRRLVGAGLAGGALWIGGNLLVELWNASLRYRSVRDLIAGGGFLTVMFFIGAVMMLSDAEAAAE